MGCPAVFGSFYLLVVVKSVCVHMHIRVYGGERERERECVRVSWLYICLCFLYIQPAKRWKLCFTINQPSTGSCLYTRILCLVLFVFPSCWVSYSGFFWWGEVRVGVGIARGQHDRASSPFLPSTRKLTRSLHVLFNFKKKNKVIYPVSYLCTEFQN